MGLRTQGVHMYFKGGNSVSTMDFSYFLVGNDGDRRPVMVQFRLSCVYFLCR